MYEVFEITFWYWIEWNIMIILCSEVEYRVQTSLVAILKIFTR